VTNMQRKRNGFKRASSRRRKPKPKPLFSFQQQRHSADCAVVSLAHALGLPYEAVLIVASRIAPKVLTRGLYTVEIVLIAKEFGFDLRRKPKVDLDADSGVLCISFKSRGEHAVFLSNGLIFETNGDVWEAEAYLKAYKARVLHILEEE
jgi:hypothetical protein